MSDLYYETSQPVGTAEPSGPESGHDSGTGRQHEAAEPSVAHGYESLAATDAYGAYQETQADTEARIAGQDELPSPAQSHEATWGDSPDYYDEAELAAEYDGDLSAFLAAEDELPTPGESRARTWGDDPDYYDEAEPAAEYDGDLTALTTDEDVPAAQHARPGPGADDTHPEPALPPQDTQGDYAQQADTENRDQDAASLTDEHPASAETAQIAAEQGPAPEADAMADVSTDAQPGRPDHAELPEGDTAKPLSPEAEQLKALETENAQARQKIADLEERNDEQATRIERLLAGTERHPDGTSTPEHGADRPGTAPDQDASRAERKSSGESADIEDAKHSRWRSAVSADSFGAAATLIDAADTVRLVAVHATPGDAMIGLGATILGLASLGLTKIEQHRKEKK
jgi:hypothetical protein